MLLSFRSRKLSVAASAAFSCVVLVAMAMAGESREPKVFDQDVLPVRSGLTEAQTHNRRLFQSAVARATANLSVSHAIAAANIVERTVMK